MEVERGLLHEMVMVTFFDEGSRVPPDETIAPVAGSLFTSSTKTCLVNPFTVSLPLVKVQLVPDKVGW